MATKDILESKDPSFLKIADLVVVTVTYGNRKHFILQMVESCQAQGVKRFVVVNNGAQWNIEELKNIYADLSFDIIDMGGNKGSAAGYAAGIETAINLGAEMVWLLDDDNRPKNDALRKLLNGYKCGLLEILRDRIAVIGYRPESQGDEFMGIIHWRINPRYDSFRGFHIFDIPRRVKGYLPFKKSILKCSLPERIVIQEAPYSGLLFHRDLIKSIGLPNRNFVLYGDDFDFTYRITNIGGRIFFIRDALIDDLESLWYSRKRYGNGLSGMLRGGEDFRLYYGMRNATYFYSTYRKRNALLFWINRSIYMGLLFLISIRYKKVRRYRLLCGAAREGLLGRLGESKRFPL